MHKETICVEVEKEHAVGSGIAGAIQPSTAFQYLDGGDQFYPRYFNTPNQDSVVAKLCALEKAESGIVFSSGMAAISTTMLALLNPGDHAILLTGLYGGTNSFISNELDSIGVETTYVDGSVESFAEAARDSTKMVYLESPTNPMLSIVDLAAISAWSRQAGIVSVIDNTFASPILQNPIDFGIDVVVHSGTKYLGGHSDLSCGAVLTSKKLAKRIKEKALRYGGSLNALMCYLLERSIKTLALRVEQQSRNAQRLAEYLDSHEHVQRAWYPGLANHPGHEIAKSQMSSFGGMIAFELATSIDVVAFLRSLNVVTPALSLGGVESTICVPSLTSHRGMSSDDLADMGLSDQVLRLSVGIENPTDLEQDIGSAIESNVGNQSPANLSTN